MGVPFQLPRSNKRSCKGKVLRSAFNDPQQLAADSLQVGEHGLTAGIAPIGIFGQSLKYDGLQILRHAVDGVRRIVEDRLDGGRPAFAQKRMVAKQHLSKDNS